MTTPETPNKAKQVLNNTWVVALITGIAATIITNNAGEWLSQGTGLIASSLERTALGTFKHYLITGEPFFDYDKLYSVVVYVVAILVVQDIFLNVFSVKALNGILLSFLAFMVVFIVPNSLVQYVAQKVQTDYGTALICSQMDYADTQAFKLAVYKAENMNKVRSLIAAKQCKK